MRADMLLVLLACLCFFEVKADAVESIRVGQYVRTKDDVQAFIDFYAVLVNIPRGVSKAFKKNQSANLRVMYMELLRKKALVMNQDASLLKSKEVLNYTAANMLRMRPAFQNLGIKKYIAREFFLVNAAYNKLLQNKQGFGAHVPKEELRFAMERWNNYAKNRRQYNTDAYINSYNLVELEVNPVHFGKSDNGRIMAILRSYLESSPIDLISMAFSKSLSAGNGGKLLGVHNSVLDDGLVRKLDTAILAGHNHVFSQENGSKVIYFIMQSVKPANVLPPSAVQVNDMLLQSALVKGLHYSFITSDGGSIAG